MAYRASTYRPGTEDEPNIPTSRGSRERSPRRNGRRSPARERTGGQGSRRLEQSENRSRSPERSNPLSGTLRRMSDLEKRRREYADVERELRAKEALQYKKVISEKSGERRQTDFRPKEINDREWGKLQTAIHARIGRYADEIIRSSWQGGAKVTKENSPRFAAEVLLYVRRRFYAETAKNAAEEPAAGYEPERDPPNISKLTLENMRWVCDTKIRPFTEHQYGKELFLCNGCEEWNKWYAFESLLQHYSSKHTSKLSKGPVAVHWRAEWPENPLFNPEPDAAIQISYSVIPSTTNSTNGPLASPRGSGVYPDNKELEKKKREQEIRDQEIKIKEAKEEIERKEQDKAKREYEAKQRQARLAEAAEKETSGLEDQVVVDNTLGENRRGGDEMSSVQQNALSTLHDNHMIPQTDYEIATEYPERSPLSQIHNSDPKARPRSPSTISVEMGNMYSKISESRAHQRLHLAGLFARFMSEVSQQTALQLRRDSAKKILEQKTAAYEKAHIMHKEFPSAEEFTKASKERAQKEFERVEYELIQKREASTKLSEEISEIVYPEEEPSDIERDVATKIEDLEAKLAQYQANSEEVKVKQQELDQLNRTLMTENDKRIIIESIGNGFSSVTQEVSALTAKMSILEAEVTQLKQIPAPIDLRGSFEGLSLRINGLEQQRLSEDNLGLASIVETLSSKVDDLQHKSRVEVGLDPASFDEYTKDLRSKLDSLSSRIDGFEAIKFELSKTMETVNSTLAMHSAAINDRTEMQSVHSSITDLSRSEGEVRAGLVKLQSQMQTLGKDLRAIKAAERGRRPLDANVRDTSGLSNDMRIAIHDEIRAQQEAVDLVLDQKFGNLEEQLGFLKGRLNPLATQLGEAHGSLNSFQNQFASQIDRIAKDLGGIKVDIQSTKEDINALKQNDIPSLQLAYNSLDYRMNNLSTEHLARQILGQLDAHIRGSEKNITTLELRLQDLERRGASGEGSTITKRDVEESLRSLRKEITDGVDEHLEKVKSIFFEVKNDLVQEQNQLRTEVDTNHSKWQNIMADLEASKGEFTGAAKSLRAEVDSINRTLQTLQDDLGATNTSCKEATAYLKIEIAKATKSNLPEKRKIESLAPVKTNGHKRRAGRSISDSDDDV